MPVSNTNMVGIYGIYTFFFPTIICTIKYVPNPYTFHKTNAMFTRF